MILCWGTSSWKGKGYVTWVPGMAVPDSQKTFVESANQEFWGQGGKWCFIVFFVLFCFFTISWAAPTACGGSQARALIGAAAASLRHSHSNAGSEPHLQPTPQLTAVPDP